MNKAGNPKHSEDSKIAFRRMSASVGCGLRADATNSKSTAIQSAAAGIADIEPIIILDTVGITSSASRTVMGVKDRE